MTMHQTSVRFAFLLPLCALAFTAAAHADTVQSTAVIYAAGTQSGLAAGCRRQPAGCGRHHRRQHFFHLQREWKPSLSMAAATLTTPTARNAAVSSSFNSGFGSISGITGPGAGYLTGRGSCRPPDRTARRRRRWTLPATASAPPLLASTRCSTRYSSSATASQATARERRRPSTFLPAQARSTSASVTQAAIVAAPARTATTPDRSTSPSRRLAAVAPAVTPEPSSLALLGTGILGIAGFARRRWSQAAI